MLVISRSPGLITAFPKMFCKNILFLRNLGWVQLAQGGSQLLESSAGGCGAGTVCVWVLAVLKDNKHNNLCCYQTIYLDWGPVLSSLYCVPSILSINSDRPLRCIRISSLVWTFMLDERTKQNNKYSDRLNNWDGQGKVNLLLRSHWLPWLSAYIQL